MPHGASFFLGGGRVLLFMWPIFFLFWGGGAFSFINVAT